jgi:HSP20 family protein
VTRVEIPIYFKEDDSSDELDFIFNTFYNHRRPVLMPVEKGWKPLTDVFETDEDVVVVIDIAGITVSDVKLTLSNNVLVIRGVRRERPSGEKRHYHKMEIAFGPFERKIDLPARIDPDRAVHRYIQGFLEIRLPKQPIGDLLIDVEIDL